MTIPQNILFPFGKHPSVRLLHQRFGPSGQLPGFRGSDPLGRESDRAPARGRCAASGTRQPFIRLHVPSITTGLYADARTLRHQKSPVLEAADLAGPRPRPFREHDDRSTSRQALDAAFHHPLALRRDPRSTGISPCIHSTQPKIGIFCTSFFDTHLKLSGSTYISGMSSID